MIEVYVTSAFETWYTSVLSDEALVDDIDHAVGLLQDKGVSLGYPYSSALKNANPIRELRIQSKGRPVRILYAFDPRRHAVLIIGGDKTGDKQFYERMIPKAQALLKTYLDEIK